MTIFKLLCFLFLTLNAVSTLPIDRTVEDEPMVVFYGGDIATEVFTEEDSIDTNAIDDNVTNQLSNLVRMPAGFRPEMQVNRYDVEITPNINGGTFDGILRAQISITNQDLRDENIRLFVEDLEVNAVSYSFVGGNTLISVTDFEINGDDGTLDINTGVEGTMYNLVVEYTGSLQTIGQGLFAGRYGDTRYLAMNLYGQNARRVFPCVDVPTHSTLISFTFHNVDDFNHIIMNSIPTDGDTTAFTQLRGPPLLWSMTAHSFNNALQPTANVLLFVRPDVSGQEAQGSSAINNFFNNIYQWTELNYFDILPNQHTQLQILALPDISRKTYGLSYIGIWEPYILMYESCSVKQRFTAFSTIAESIARLWFGNAVYPENFRFEWVLHGVASYAGFELLKGFQTPVPSNAEDISMLDVHTLFVTEVIQESLLRDGYIAQTAMQPADNIFDQNIVREHLNGILNYKAPAILRMLRFVLGGPDHDFIKYAGRGLMLLRSGDQPFAVNSAHFSNALSANYDTDGSGLIDNIEEYLDPYIRDNGCPLLAVSWRQGGVSVTLERFNYFRASPSDYNIPLTYSISNAPNFEEARIYPERMLDGTLSIDMFLDEDDYVLFNVQGQGYYRVHYDNILWERILEALRDPDRRAEIHPLNRATLIDDALNLARGGRLEIGTALEVVLTWEHETEYAPWRAFVRNMDFLRKHLVAMVLEDEDLDQDIYLRMVRRTIGAFENEIGFIPDPQEPESAMTSLTRGVVMEHACKAGYQPCIAAALDLFYDGDVVNPSIPTDIRPAVYCTAVREGDMAEIEALLDRLEIENSMWERVVILESLACSTNDDYINGLLTETIAENAPYTTEERNKIFKAVAESSYQNAQHALTFLSNNVIEIRQWYGGDEKLENLLVDFAENVVHIGFIERFQNFVSNSDNNLDDAQHIAIKARAFVNENLVWEQRLMQNYYDWIDENGAPTLIVSFTLMLFSCIVALFNH